MKKSLIVFASLAMLTALPVAQAQDTYRRDRGDNVDRRDNERDWGRGRYSGAATATPTELAAADRRLNQVYQRRIADARAADRRDRRFRGWYSQEVALRETERNWIGFRDAECRYLTQQDAGSRNQGAIMRGCLVGQTNDRLAELRDAETMLSSR